MTMLNTSTKRERVNGRRAKTHSLALRACTITQTLAQTEDFVTRSIDLATH
jgi:hypothetical protein